MVGGGIDCLRVLGCSSFLLKKSCCFTLCIKIYKEKQWMDGDCLLMLVERCFTYNYLRRKKMCKYSNFNV